MNCCAKLAMADMVAVPSQFEDLEWIVNDNAWHFDG